MAIIRIDGKPWNDGIKSGVKARNNSAAAIFNNLHVKDETGLPALRVLIANPTVGTGTGDGGTVKTEWVIDQQLDTHFLVSDFEANTYTYYDAPGGNVTLPVLPVVPYDPQELEVGRSYDVEANTNGWSYKSKNFGVWVQGEDSNQWVINTSSFNTPFVKAIEVLSYAGQSLMCNPDTTITLDKQNNTITINLFASSTGEVWLQAFS